MGSLDLRRSNWRAPEAEAMHDATIKGRNVIMLIFLIISLANHEGNDTLLGVSPTFQLLGHLSFTNPNTGMDSEQSPQSSK